ncbi:CgeB family protein [Desulforamulus aeronauticus]|uniref:Spore maturation protein CgeB n=1 Tax=Desulforamulus aeronauticus DSM 10349 TaxID=1121421 RepID=A0A1M6TEJ3_9FIRM|nr:glycosyltransferase [Desulforamulus aeronauticus]SHK55256.1 Spore maturation protein CgeB [Desulforamulus aeronauticus DSM 10349]
MKILFIEIDPQYLLGLPPAFEEHGCEVKILQDIIEEELEQLFSKDRPDLVFTVGWTKIHTHAKLEILGRMVEKYQLKHAYWATEDSRWTEEWSLPYIKATKPAYIFTLDRETLALYSRLGLKAHYLPWACNPGFHRPAEPKEEYQCDIALVATGGVTWNSFRRNSAQILLKPLVERGYDVAIWGKRWDTLDPDIVGFSVDSRHLRGKLSYLETNHVYSSAKIMLGFQNITTELTSRTYEIMGARGFLLTPATFAVLEKFKPGKHFVISQSEEDTLRLVDHYLHHAAERQKIALNGQQEVYSYPHTYQNRAAQILQFTGLW